MSEERVRREVRELVESFGPPSSGLAARAVAGLPDRGRRSWRPVPRLAASLAVLLALIAVVLWLAPRAANGPLPGGQGGLGALRQRPLVNVPLAGPGCQVDERRANIRAESGQIAMVSSSNVPLGALMTVQSVYKPDPLTTISVQAGPQVSGPVLVRGRRLDGPGSMSFVLAPGRGAAHRPELALDVVPRQRSWDVSFQASSPGCYAIQFDGARFTEEAVLTIWPGTPATMNPAQAAAEVRAAVTGVHPVLLPTAVGADWRTEVTTGAASFSVTYADPATVRIVALATASSGLLPDPTAGTVTAFRGDPHAVYQVIDGTRLLWWQEPGGVFYRLSATGMTDAEFWQIASSLR